MNARAPFQYGGQELCGLNKLGRNTQAVCIWQTEQLVKTQTMIHDAKDIECYCLKNKMQK